MSKGRSLGIVHNSLFLISAKVSIMAMGFVFWLVAARNFDASTVGLAAGAVSAVMLCTQLALLGVGSAFITFLPEHRERPAHLFGTAVGTVAITSFIVSFAFLVVGDRVLQQLSSLIEQPLFAVSFLVVGVVGTLGILFDQASTALRRGDQAMTRAVVSGGVTLAQLIVLAIVVSSPSANAIFFTWVTGGVAAAVFAVWQFSRVLPGYRLRTGVDRGLAGHLLRVGIPNHLLTLTERLPGFVLPIAVTELLSPRLNAYWYAAWMMAWVVFIIPIQVGMTLFAESSNRPEDVTSHVAQGIKTSLVLGLLGAAAAAILAPFVLGLLGSEYAAAGTTPLRILVIGVVPLTVIQAYFSICRARRQLSEALLVGTIAAIGGTIAAVVVGVEAGLVGMAATWVVAQFLVGGWAFIRLRSLISGPPGRADDMEVVAQAARAVPSTRVS